MEKIDLTFKQSIHAAERPPQAERSRKCFFFGLVFTVSALLILPPDASAREGRNKLGGREQREANAQGVAANANGVSANAQSIRQLFDLADVFSEAVSGELDSLNARIDAVEAAGLGLSGGSCVSDEDVGALTRVVFERGLAESDPASVALAGQIYSNLNRAGVVCDERMRLNVVLFFQPEPAPDANPPLEFFVGKVTGHLEADLNAAFDFLGLPIINPPIQASEAAAGDLAGGSCVSDEEVEAYRQVVSEAGFAGHPYFVFVEDLFANLNQAGVVCDERMRLDVVIFGSPEPSPDAGPPLEFFVGTVTGDFHTDLTAFFNFILSR